MLWLLFPFFVLPLLFVGFFVIGQLVIWLVVHLVPWLILALVVWVAWRLWGRRKR